MVGGMMMLCNRFRLQEWRVVRPFAEANPFS